MADHDDDEDVPGVTDSKQGLILALARARSERSKYRDQLNTLQAEHAKTVQTWEAERAKWTQENEAAKAPREAEAAELARLRAEASAWGEERALLAAGIADPEGMDFARHAFSRVPEADRPKGGIGEWLKAADKLPKAVAAYLPGTTGGAQQQAPKAPAHNPNAGTGTPRGGAPAAVTPEAALRDGTQREHRAAYLEQLGLKAYDLDAALGRKGA